MEGLLIAEQLRMLEPQLPASRYAWRFPDPYTFVLPLQKGALWLYNKPPNPRAAFKDEVPPARGAHTGFHDLLVARASGRLEGVTQPKLDRALSLHFAAAEGFVSTPPVVLIAELTGRNCNLILTDTDGLILGVAREVTSEINRFRQLRAGLRYQPPPPYEKLDPRTAPDEALKEALAGRTLNSVRKVVDGVGPDLTRALSLQTGFAKDHRVEGEDMDTLFAALRRLAKEPSGVMREVVGLPDLETVRETEARDLKLQRLRSALEKQRHLLEKRLDDIEKTRRAAAEADALRAQADVLMAFQKQVPPNADEVTLTGFAGETLNIELEPRLDAIGNAQALYERAKKREQRQTQAEAREEDIFAELEKVEDLLEELASLSPTRLDDLSETYVVKPKKQVRAQPGIRYKSPQGYNVLVGRNSRDNDTITFRLARSRDVWLHVQGYTGSHVIVQAENKEVPFETVLYAAQLAAAYSKAGGSDNVPVDYTLKKNVWKPKGAPAGAVNFTQQKTVYVTPSRRPEAV